MKTNHHIGIIFTLLSAFFYAVQAAIIKGIDGSVPVPVLVFIQSLIALIILIPIIGFKQVKSDTSLFKSKVPVLHIWRTIFSLGISYFLFIALHFVPLVDGVLLANTSPFFIPFILFIFMRQKLQHKMWLPLIAGFIGIILILKPDSHIFDAYSLIALGAGISMALSMTMVRQISAYDNSITIVFYYFLFSTIIAGIVSIAFWTPISLQTVFDLIIIGVLFFLVQYLLVLGLTYTTAQNVGVLYYSNVIFAAILGMLFFSEVSDFISIIGILLTIISAIVIIRLPAAKKIK
ncbi:DMT family transporter [Fangia hongkongensis]|uniref:DMT family transporter n=1 Tax=Fangia hongkongensis TaxID=270495 RepID=UPI00036D9A56|nr:DMT family transporter [Fangia hongkongensis]